jgi:hypothetical protein
MAGRKFSATKKQSSMKKKKNKKRVVIFSLLILSFFLLTSYFLLVFIQAKKLFSGLSNNQPQTFIKNFNGWQKLTPFFKNFNQFLADFVGQDKEKTYFVLLQNNLELRPSGGFMGSYAKLKFKKGSLAGFSVQDIYVPDGQLKGHVQPPWPIQEAFQQGFWKLRDSNWEPDFPLAAKTIHWFFEKGGEEKSDGLIALNFLVIENLLKIFGPCHLSDYQSLITADNFYQIAQKEAEKDFFPGSTQKKDFLSALAKQLIFKLQNANLKQSLQLIKIVKKSLDEKQILLNFNHPQLQQYILSQNWDGGLKRQFRDSDKYMSDYLSLVETNLGANKANLYVQRKVSQEINFENNILEEKLMINYFNNSPEERPNDENFWGGVYENFLRVFIPLEAKNIKIKINEQDFKGRTEIKEYEDKKIKSVGFFVEVAPLLEARVKIEYNKKLTHPTPGVKYILEIQKQPGVEAYQQTIKFLPKNKTLEKNIKTDITLNF